MTLDAQIEALQARSASFSAFADHQRHLCSGPNLEAVVAAGQHALSSGQAQQVLLFHDASGSRTELNAGEGPEAVRQRLLTNSPAEGPSGPGRPKLGVVSREVSLLPRHWDWLATQRGGASAALRRLIEEARKGSKAQDAALRAREALDKALTVLAGNQPGFEEALRALYAADFATVAKLCAPWPDGLGGHFQQQVAVAQAWHELALAEAEAVHFTTPN